MARPVMAPLCWGQASSFTPSSKHCKGCEEGVSCAQECLSKFETIHEKLDVSDLVTRTQAYLDRRGIRRVEFKMATSLPKTRFAEAERVSFDVPPAVQKLASKPRKLATAIAKRGINMALDAQQGVNRFEKFRPTYMRDIQELLITGNFNRDAVKTVIVEDRALSPIALNNATSTVYQALTALGVLSSDGEFYASSD